MVVDECLFKVLRFVFYELIDLCGSLLSGFCSGAELYSGKRTKSRGLSRGLVGEIENKVCT